MLKSILKWLLGLLYRVNLEGRENYFKSGDRTLIVANHLSFLDALLLALFLPGKPMFAINSYIAQRWYIKPFTSMVKLFPLDPTNPLAIRAIIKEVKKGQPCVIFPEGRITVTGSLMKIYEGPGMIADKASANILPVRIDGAQYSFFSRLKGKVRLRWLPNITIRLLEPKTLDINATIKGKKRRFIAGQKLYDLMSEMLFDTSDYQKPLFQSLIDQTHIHGHRHVIAEDPERKPINYGQLILRSFILGQAITKDTAKGEHVGFLLPNMVNSIIVFFAMQAYGRIPAMLNYSTGIKSLLCACTAAEIKVVYTSRKFVQAGKLTPLIEARVLPR